jgi:hypothetical protein
MINKQLSYFYRDYDSNRVSGTIVKRAYYDTDRARHQLATQQLKKQLGEMLCWISEHKVLPTVEGSFLHEWAESPLRDAEGNKMKQMPCRTTIPERWVENITDVGKIWRNPKTGRVQHTQPCVIGVLGGIVGNLATQTELSKPQIESLNLLFDSTRHAMFDYLFPDHWHRYEFVHGANQQVGDNLSQVFGS